MSSLPAFLEARRSIRSYLPESVPRDLIDSWIEAACIAPAPHHSRPWRFVAIDSAAAKADLANGMGERWRRDLTGDGVDLDLIDSLIEKSHRTITSAPALVLGCLTNEGLDDYPDDQRRLAEWGLALLSLGAAVENLMLAAADSGWSSCWVAAPMFCPEEARDSLKLPSDWLPHALVTLGRADPNYIGRPRPEVPLESLRRFI